YCSSLSGRTLGLHIKGIEANSRSKRDSLFQEDECIVQINDVPLQDKTFAQSQEVFRQAMGSPSVRLEVLPAANKSRYEKSLIGQLFTSDIKDPASRTKSPLVARAKRTRSQSPDPAPDQIWPGRTREPGPRSGPAGGPSGRPPVSTRQDQPEGNNPVLAALANLANKKGGKKIRIDLKKGVEGLGFTVVTRDSPANGPSPILVKNILQRGAAIKDGRLQPGTVNGVDMTGRSQEELVAMLRSTKQGESVSWWSPGRTTSSCRGREEAGSLVLEDGRERGSAGLGVSLKGNNSKRTGDDLGISSSPSSTEGRLQGTQSLRSQGQRLIAVNGESLLGRSNHTAMETLRRSMSSEGNARGTIQLVVLRASRRDQQVAPTPGSPSTPPICVWIWGDLLKFILEFPPPPPPPPPPPIHDKNRVRESMTNKICVSSFSSALHPAAATNGGSGHYSNDEDDVEQSHFPPPPSPGALGPTLGLWKSSSLESLQSAMSEAKQSRVQVQVPFHRPRPHVVRGRGCNQSFRIAIDKSYEGPSEDDDDLSENSSGRDTPASSSSRQDLDAEDEKKKSKGKKKAKKSKGKKKQADSAEDPEKKSKKKGFGLLRFGRKKEDKSKTAPKTSKSKLEALSEEELERLPGLTTRATRTRSPGTPRPTWRTTTATPNYARINNFRAPPSPQSYLARTPSPANPPPAVPDELDGLYAKVNKPRPRPRRRPTGERPAWEPDRRH
uniref:PDZ domain-containing protein n=1 Tax=Salarias fasciatus TaxID=181472 RepID=A0A672FWF5_SALFA